MKPRSVIAFAAMLLIAAQAWALQARDLRQLTMRDGLTDLTINDIYKDTLGYVYFGTDISVDRFDGERIRRFPIPGSNELLRRVRTVVTGPDGALYAGNGDGLWRFSDDHFDHVAPSVIQAGVNKLLPHGDSLFIATDKGLYIMHAGSFRHILPGATSVISDTNRILGLCMAPDRKTLWGSSIGSLISVDLPSGRVTRIPYVGHPGHRFHEVVQCGPYLYLSSQGAGIVRYDPASGEFAKYRDWGNYDVLTLSTDGDSTLYVGVNGDGVHFIDTRSDSVMASYTYSPAGTDGLRSNSVYSLLVDPSGQMWVGYYQAGVDYTVGRRSLFDIYAVPGLIDTRNLTVRSVAIENDLKLIGTREGLYVVDEALGRCTVFGRPQLASGMVFAIKKYRGEYYVGTGGGMYIYNPASNTIRPYADPAFPQGASVLSFDIDALDRLWVGTSVYVICIDGNKVVHLFNDKNSQMPHPGAYEVFFDSAGTGWFCTEQGVAIFDGKNVRTSGFKIAGGAFNREKIRSIYEDSRHNLYFIPDRGIPVRTNLQLSEYDYVHSAGVTGPLPSSINPTFIIEDSDSLLWIGSSDGLICTDLHDRYNHFTGFDGLPSLSFTLSKPVRDSEGNLWFGNTRGLVMLDREKFKSMHQGLPSVKITEVRSNGEILVNGGKPIDQVSLTNGHKSLQVLFSDFSFTSPEYQSFEYRLSPKMADNEWLRVHDASEVSLYDLDNGDYTLTIRHLGDPSSEAVLPIRVSNYGYLLSLPVILLCIAIIALAAGLAMCYRSLSKLRSKVADKSDDDKYRGATISPDSCKRLHRKLEKLMAEQQPYLDPRLKISSLAEMLGASTLTMSYLFNRYLDTNYYDYVNTFRVKHFCKMVSEGGDSRYTLTAMSEKCGFSSRASFFRSFSKVMGISPGEYIRQQHA